MQINNKKIIITVLLIVGFIIALSIYMIYTNNSNEIDLANMIMQEEIIENDTDNLVTNSTGEEAKMIIHISGEVKNPGIVTLEVGSRIMDAIKKAGGATREADLTQVNLAYELQDGQKVYIPNKKEKVTEYITESSGNNVIVGEKNISNNNEGNDSKVNINTANLDELDSLPGIGPALAQRIIDYREQNGNFQSIEDLQNVKGIGDSKFSDIKDNIIV